MAQLHMISYKLQDMQFFNKLEAPGQIQLENNFSFSVDYDRAGTRCVAKLYQCVKDKAADNNHKFFVSVEMLGVFEITGAVSEGDKRAIHVETYNQVFPYAEMLVKQLCAAGGMPNFVLLRHRMTPEQVALNGNG